MQTWADEQLERLKPLWPDFELWISPHYIGPDVWCARPVGAPVATINEESPEAFIVSLARARDNARLEGKGCTG